MKRLRKKIVGVVAWDYQLARIIDQVGVEMVVVGDSVGVNLWGHRSPFEVTVEQMIVVGQAVRRGVHRALVCCDFPYGPLQEGRESAVRLAIRLVKEVGADVVKLDGAGDYPEAVTAIERAGIPVCAQLGITPQRALRYGVDYQTMTHTNISIPDQLMKEIVIEAKRLEQAGAALLDLTNAGPVVGAEVVGSVEIPVLGGLGGGPWLDGRIRMAHAAIGYNADWIDRPSDAYANVARLAFDALSEFATDVREGRQLKGAPAKSHATGQS